MDASKSSKSAGPGSANTPRVRAKVTAVSTHAGTIQRIIVFVCPRCGLNHRVTELGFRSSACRRGLVFVTAGGGR
jgi:predicted RNA-binding Zn-ribbon protein involved in translation (DUF1610 family)